MSETSITQQQKQPVSKLAKISLVFSLVGFVCALPGSYLFHLEYQQVAAIISSMALLCTGLGFIFGIASFLVILIGRRTGWMTLAVSFIFLAMSSLLIPAFCQPIRPILRCASNCHTIYSSIKRYTGNHNNRPPSFRIWCDVLTPEDINENKLICPGACHKGDKGPCHYAVNPACEPNSPNDVVFLFETKGGWNQYGGPELISFDNHVRKGANVLFNDGQVKFIKPKDVGKLKWKAEDINSVK